MTTIHDDAPVILTHERDMRVMKALDGLKVELTPAQRVRIWEAIYHPTRHNWQQAALIRVTLAHPLRPQARSLWSAMVAHFRPTFAQAHQIPTGAQIIETLENAWRYV